MTKGVAEAAVVYWKKKCKGVFTMSVLRVEYYSRALSTQAHFSAVLPNDIPPMMTDNPCYTRPSKVLVLLHGYSGCDSDWLTGSSIRELAAQYNLAVLMPAAGNSFYLNGEASGTFYADFVGKELPEFAAKMFGLNISRENMWIGGLSMGGFGALHTALQFPDRFSKAMALSSALIIHELPEMRPETGNSMANYAYYKRTFGDLKTAPERDCNPEILVKKIQKEDSLMPDIFMACGTEDFLYEPNCAFHRFLEENRVHHVYRTAPGIHNWKFWEENLEPGIRWMLECEG